MVDYVKDNWLRCWFSGIDMKQVEISVIQGIDGWRVMIAGALRELARVLEPGGHVAFEVGEVRGGKVKLEEVVLEAARESGSALRPRLILINTQEFTKTADIWGVDNNAKGTNTNRIVLLEKDT